MDKIFDKIVVLGVLGLVLLIAMATSGWVSATDAKHRAPGSLDSLVV